MKPFASDLFLFLLGACAMATFWLILVLAFEP